MAHQQFFRLLPTVTTKMGMQQIDHRPKVAAFLYIDLKQVAHIVE